MRATLIIIFWIVYYVLIGVIHYWYFRRYRREEFDKEKLFYLFGYGGRARFGVSGVLAFFTTELYLYGSIWGAEGDL